MSADIILPFDVPPLHYKSKQTSRNKIFKVGSGIKKVVKQWNAPKVVKQGKLPILVDIPVLASG